MLRPPAIASLVLVLVGCDGTSGPTATAVSCETRSHPVVDVDAHFCIEYQSGSDFQTLGLRSGCEAASSIDGGLDIHSTFTEAPCSRETVVGSCTLGGSLPSVVFYYADSIPPPSAESCTSRGGTWSVP